MNSKDLANLMFSPQWIAKLLHHFLSGAQSVNPTGIKTELIYLSIPFIIDDVTRKQLANAKSSSNFSSIFQKNNTLEINNSLIKKNEQIKQFHQITNYGLIYLANIKQIHIGEFIFINETVEYKKEKDISRDYCKSSYNLGVILAKEDYRNFFVKLGITNL